MKWTWLLLCSIFVASCSPAELNQRANPQQGHISAQAEVQDVGPDHPPVKKGHDVRRVKQFEQTGKPAPQAAMAGDIPTISSPRSAKQTRARTVRQNVMVRGIYVPSRSIENGHIENLLAFIKRHRLNAVVLDVKDDHGVVRITNNASRVIARIKQQHIYVIGRIVTFKDPYLARSSPNWAIHSKHGGLWTQHGVAWVDPYRPEVWRYNVEVARKAVRIGFDEIQWDYVRFPDVPPSIKRDAIYTNPKGLSESENISRFLQYARRNLATTPISADVFGLVTTAQDDMGIGQTWEKIVPYVDYISPMMYPSHYGNGIYGIRSPVRAPYFVIEHGIADAKKRNQQLARKGYHTAVIRPWLQDFDMVVPYGRQEVHAQINAASKQGVKGYLLWNQGGQYTE